ncbi:CYFA0S11e02498g1_1 [Cyberlindnera fabianii]|uniref:CYFA0S11e02498g1_1 n=1 Tax=Cyberlindnera fabianii TaxID=36022 RepID=A0A061B011_CYBFA|nr:CYFA0S11e02498g1_1 [Cyberlindnera fabianii]
MESTTATATTHPSTSTNSTNHTAATPVSPLENHSVLAMDQNLADPAYTYSALSKTSPPTRAVDADETTEEDNDTDDSEKFSFPQRSSPQALTKESLLLLNLKHAAEPLHDLPSDESRETSNFTTTPKLTPSSSSVTSFDENSEDSKAIQRFYNNSSSSLATIVQRFASSTSTLNLQSPNSENRSDDLTSVASEADKNNSCVPKTPTDSFMEKLATDLSATSLSSLTSKYDDTTGFTTDTNSAKVVRRLKSSLKLPGLTRCKSMPSAKTVRFSTDLEKVKTFSEYARPSAISLDNSPEQSPDLDDEFDGPYGRPKALFELNSSNFYGNSSSDSDDSEEDYFTYKSKVRTSKWKMSNMNFDLFSNSSSFNLPAVKLTSLKVSDNLLRGTVEVANLTFEKYVEVKFTTDSWKSIYLVTGSYKRSLDSNRDQFTFEINLNKSIMMNSSRMLKKNSATPIKVELCVKYVSGGFSLYYDNNNSENYKFQLESRAPEKKQLPVKKRNNSGRSAAIDSNFVSAKINTPPKVMTSGRYFSEDTDYFNYSPNKMKWFDSNFTSSSSSSVMSTQKTSSNSSSETLTKSSTSSTIKPPSSSNGVPQTYSDFLQKYCFFKSDEPNGADRVCIR